MTRTRCSLPISSFPGGVVLPGCGIGMPFTMVGIDGGFGAGVAPGPQPHAPFSFTSNEIPDHTATLPSGVGGAGNVGLGTGVLSAAVVNNSARDGVPACSTAAIGALLGGVVRFLMISTRESGTGPFFGSTMSAPARPPPTCLFDTPCMCA